MNLEVQHRLLHAVPGVSGWEEEEEAYAFVQLTRVISAYQETLKPTVRVLSILKPEDFFGIHRAITSYDAMKYLSEQGYYQYAGVRNAHLR